MRVVRLGLEAARARRARAKKRARRAPRAALGRVPVARGAQQHAREPGAVSRDLRAHEAEDEVQAVDGRHDERAHLAVVAQDLKGGGVLGKGEDRRGDV